MFFLFMRSLRRLLKRKGCRQKSLARGLIGTGLVLMAPLSTALLATTSRPMLVAQHKVAQRDKLISLRVPNRVDPQACPTFASIACRIAVRLLLSIARVCWDARCTGQVRKAFKKFGTIVSVRRYVQGAPRRADVSYSSAAEMQAPSPEHLAHLVVSTSCYTPPPMGSDWGCYWEWATRVA